MDRRDKRGVRKAVKKEKKSYAWLKLMYLVGSIVLIYTGYGYGNSMASASETERKEEQRVEYERGKVQNLTGGDYDGELKVSKEFGKYWEEGKNGKKEYFFLVDGEVYGVSKSVFRAYLGESTIVYR